MRRGALGRRRLGVHVLARRCDRSGSDATRSSDAEARSQRVFIGWMVADLGPQWAGMQGVRAGADNSGSR